MKQEGNIVLIILIIAAIIGGYLIYSGKINFQKLTPQQITQPSPSDETANPDSIGANWKTYTNGIGFSVKYPTNLETKSGKDFLTINDPRTFQNNGCATRNKLRIEMYINKSDEISIQQIMDKRVNDPTYHLSNPKIIKIDNIEALRSDQILNECMDSEVIYILYKGYLIGISKYPLNSEENSIFEEFLATFKFQ